MSDQINPEKYMILFPETAFRAATRILGIAVLLLVALPVSAQSAPIPVQLTTSKTAFLANAGATPANNQLATLAYNNVYQGLVAQQRFQLTPTPGEADLICEVSVISIFEGQTSSAQYIQLVIRDAKSQSLLWTIAEGIGIANREATLEKNAVESASKLVADLNAVIAGSFNASPSKQVEKKRFSQDNPK